MINKKIIPLSLDLDVSRRLKEIKKSTKVPTSAAVNSILRKEFNMGR